MGGDYLLNESNHIPLKLSCAWKEQTAGAVLHQQQDQEHAGRCIFTNLHVSLRRHGRERRAERHLTTYCLLHLNVCPLDDNARPCDCTTLQPKGLSLRRQHQHVLWTANNTCMSFGLHKIVLWTTTKHVPGLLQQRVHVHWTSALKSQSVPRTTTTVRSLLWLN